MRMVDTPKKIDPALPESDKTALLNRIDELENLLHRKKTEVQQQNQNPRLKVGTDGIPVLVESVTEEDMNFLNPESFNALKRDDEIINDIINKVDKEISQDLDELIVLLKDSIIDEVKTRLLKELHINDAKTDKNQNNN